MHSLVSSLIIEGRIRTTEAKAKETKDIVDKVITKAKRSADRPMEMVRKLDGEISRRAIAVLRADMGRFATRTSGYSRVVKCVPRSSDSARMAIIELVDRATTSRKSRESDVVPTEAVAVKDGSDTSASEKDTTSPSA